MKKMTKKTKFLTITLSFIMATILAASIFVIYAKNVAVAASNDAYTSLSSQRDIIKEDFNKVYSYDNFTIAPADDGYKITLTAPSHDIAMICNYDSNFNYIDSTYIEPAITGFYFELIIIFIVLGGIFSVALVWIGKNLYYH